MFDFQKKDLELLYQSQIKNDIDEFPLPSRYLFINNGKILFISKYRDEYRLYSSGNTGFIPFRTTSTFDILFINKDFSKVYEAFQSYIYDLWSKI